MEYQKFGRGGAGNIYSQEETEVASKQVAGVRVATTLRDTRLTKAKDVETQRKGSIARPEDKERARLVLAPTGRGGAGNYTSSSKLATVTTKNANITPSLQETRPPQVGHSGRGGAGNYRSGDVEKKEEDETMAIELQERTHQWVVKDVEKGLKEPEKAHLGNEKLEYDTPR